MHDSNGISHRCCGVKNSTLLRSRVESINQIFFCFFVCLLDRGQSIFSCFRDFFYVFSIRLLQKDLQKSHLNFQFKYAKKHAHRSKLSTRIHCGFSHFCKASDLCKPQSREKKYAHCSKLSTRIRCRASRPSCRIRC